jgi:hypothetical protein
MNASLDRMAVQAAVNPAVLHILSRNLNVLDELRQLGTTRTFGAQLEAYLAIEEASLEQVLEQIRERVIEMWAARGPAPARAA